jgi:hypothetical protein
MADNSTPWEEFEVSPVEIAMPGNRVGLTLRAYRMASTLTPTDVSEREDEDEVFAGRRGSVPLDEEDLPEFEWTKEQLDAIADEPADDAQAEAAAEADESEDEEEDEEEPDDEEVPVFLSHKGKVLLFKSPEGLVEFVKSKAPHDLTQLKDWKKLAAALKPEDVKADEGDTYELDLVVENLRGGPDAWDAGLVLAAGEIARDLGYALQLNKVIVALSPGSPLDDLDDALRATGFFARRKLKKIGSEQASLGWRTIIGKISSSVDWRD